MRTLVKKDLDWIPDAPVSVTRTRRLGAPVDRVWAVIADHERWPEWFTALEGVERVGSGEGVGGRRRVRLKQLTVEEEFLAWEPNARFGFVVTHVDRPGIRSMVEDIRLRPDGDAATTVTYAQAAEPVAAVVIAPLLRRLFARNLDKGLAGLDRQVTG